MVIDLLKRFIAICFFKTGPQSLPESKYLLLTVIVFHIGLSAISGADALTLQKALAYSLANLLILAVLTKLVLGFNKLQHRFILTMTALVGCETLISILQLAVRQIPGLGISPEKDKIPVYLVFWFFWWLAIQGNILSHAINTSKLKGALLSIWFTLVTGFIMAPFVIQNMPKSG